MTPAKLHQLSQAKAHANRLRLEGTPETDIPAILRNHYAEAAVQAAMETTSALQ